MARNRRGMCGRIAVGEQRSLQEEHPDSILHMVQRELEIDSSTPFAEVYPGKPEALRDLLTNLYANQSRAAKRLREDYPPNKRGTSEWRSKQYSWALLCNSANALIAGFVLLRRGYIQEPIAVLRVAAEHLMCAIYLHDNVRLIPTFEKGNLGRLYRDALGAVKKVLGGEFGRLWGILSEPGTHVNKQNVLACRIEGEPTAIRVGAYFGPSKEEKEVRSVIIEYYLKFAQVLAEAPERIFFDEHRARAIAGRPK